MDLKVVYARFITDRRGREHLLQPGGYDVHHVVPRCLGGTNDPNNLVKLSHGDHLFAHVVLSKIYPDNHKLLTAASRMSGMTRYRGKHSRKRYDHVRKAHSRSMLGNKRGAGATRSEQFKKSLSERSKGQQWSKGRKLSQEQITGMHARMLGNKYGVGNKSHLGKKNSEQFCKEQSERMLGNSFAKGTKRTPEQIAYAKAKRAEAVAGRPDPKLGTKQSPELIARRMEGMRRARERRKSST